MDNKLDQYRTIIQRIVHDHAQYQPSHGGIEPLPLCDRQTDSYLLLDIGWDSNGRVHSVAFHVRIKNEKIWIEWDGTTPGIVQELMDAGIPQAEIVLGFYRPDRRAMTDFATA